MALNWYGIDGQDEPIKTQRPVECLECKARLIWTVDIMYNGPPPKHDCGGKTVVVSWERANSGWDKTA